MPAAVPEADRRSRLAEQLRAASDAGGFLPFDRFQEIALYAPGLGYYESPAAVLGPAGDFYTAGHVHPLFGATVADRVVREFVRLGSPPRFRVVEVGPGDGTLARVILAEAYPRLADRTEFEYVLVERSSALRDRALAALGDEAPAGSVRLSGAVGADGPFVGAVIANEFLDAQPTRRLVRRGDDWAELGVRTEGTEFREAEGPRTRALAGPELPAGVPEGTVVEIPNVAEAFVREVADHLEEGVAILIDYGSEEAELVGGHPSGTLQAIEAHRVRREPFDAPGSADLSTFVNFSRIRAVAQRAGLREVAYARQSEALGRWGFEERFGRALASATSAEEEVRLRLSVKNLLFGFDSFRVLELEGGPVRAD